MAGCYLVFRSNGLRCGQLAVTVGLRYVATPVFSSQTSPAVYDRRAIRREKLAGKAQGGCAVKKLPAPERRVLKIARAVDCRKQPTVDDALTR